MSDETTLAEPAEPLTVELARTVPAQLVERTTLYDTTDPGRIMAAATSQADVLKAAIDDRKLYAVMGRDPKTGEERRHVLYEGWALCGTLLGVYAVIIEVRPIPGADGRWQPFVGVEEWYTNDRGKRQKRVNVVQEGIGGWQATAHAVTRDGAIVGGDVAVCTWDERRWRQRTSAEVLGMAQTRAKSRALRGPLGFVVALAGFAATPGEEMAEAVPALPIDVDGEVIDFGPYLGRAQADDDGATIGALKRYAVEVAADKEQAAAVFGQVLAEVCGDLPPDEFGQTDLLQKVAAGIKKGVADAEAF